MENNLVKQGWKHIHSVLDLKDAFHQIPLRKEDRYITGTVTPRGLFNGKWYQWDGKTVSNTANEIWRSH